MIKSLAGGILAATAFVMLSSAAHAAGPEIVSGPAAQADCFAPWSADTKFFKYPKKEGPFRIAFANGYIANTWRIQMVQTAKAYAAQPDVKAKIKEFKVVSTGEDVPAQISAINNFIDSGYDAIVTDAQNPTAFGPVIKRAKEAGIVLVAFDNILDTKDAINVNVDQKGLGELWAKWLVEHLPNGGKVLETFGANPDDIDFSALIAEIKLKNPDVVYMGASMPQLALFLKQMRQQGVKAQFIGPDLGLTPDFITQASPAFAEGALMTFQLPPYDSSPELKEFTARHQARFGRAPGPYAAVGYIDAQVMAAAIEKAKEPTREAVLSQLRGIKVDTLLGPVTFDKNGENKNAPIYLYVVKNGKFELVKDKD